MIDLHRDETYMTAALALGRRNLGRAAPNPAVGALVVRDGVIVGRGFTGISGRPHAETMALAEAGEAARGATLYASPGAAMRCFARLESRSRPMCWRARPDATISAIRFA